MWKRRCRPGRAEMGTVGTVSHRAPTTRSRGYRLDPIKEWDAGDPLEHPTCRTAMTSPETLIVVWTLGVLGVVAALALWDERVRRRVGADISEDRIFRCGQCSLVYTDDPKVDRSRCPGCGRTNSPVQF